ncbi:hypothetical protein M3226_02750 [Neobacillus cucumis]|uniref:hypothetical protein n=1 Tax=Neobacillus cucumis TaxID=1740721 RepID=UPI00203AE67B|nr:hypothetical protein [Neobacillus cucumis]MCM3724621.1 hypothetical protein [Neobacillus cucumis]
MKTVKELKGYAIGDDFKFQIVQVVISQSKEIAAFWLRDIAGYTNAEMEKFKISAFPLDKKVFIRDFGETTANELMKQIPKYPAVVFWKEKGNDYYENWLSHFEPDKPSDG